MITGTKRQPDFLVEAPDGSNFYLECLRLSDGPHEDRGGKRNNDILRDALNSVESKYYLDLKVSGFSKQTPSKNKFCASVRQWLDEIDDERAEATNPLLWTHEDMTVRVALLKPITPKSDPKYRSIGVEFGGLQTLPLDGGFRQPLRNKMRRYGKPDIPLVIALTSPDFFVGEAEVLTALFGDEAVTIDSSTGVATPVRTDNGIWGHNPWHYSQCSGVLYFKNLVPSRASVRKGVFIHHPGADHPISLQCLPITETQVLDDGTIQTIREGKPLGELLGLSAEWPENAD